MRNFDVYNPNDDETYEVEVGGTVIDAVVIAIEAECGATANPNRGAGKVEVDDAEHTGIWSVGTDRDDIVDVEVVQR